MVELNLTMVVFPLFFKYFLSSIGPIFIIKFNIAKAPPFGKHRGYNPKRLKHAIDSNFRAVVFSGRLLFLLRSPIKIFLRSGLRSAEILKISVKRGHDLISLGFC